MDPPLEGRKVVAGWPCGRQHFLPTESGLQWTQLSALGCHLGAGLRLGATSCNAGHYTAPRARAELLTGQSTCCLIHEDLTRRLQGCCVCTSTLLSVLWYGGTVQHLWAPKQACDPSHKMRVTLLAVTSQGKRDAPNGSQLLVWAMGAAEKMIFLAFLGQPMHAKGWAPSFLPFLFLPSKFRRYEGNNRGCSKVPHSYDPVTLNDPSRTGVCL